MTTEPWFLASIMAVLGLSLWAAVESRGGTRFVIVVLMVAVAIGLPYVFLADAFEASTLPERDATVRTYVIGVGLLVLLDLGALLGRRRRARRRNDVR